MADLVLTFAGCSTGESRLCFLPGQHTRADPNGGGGVGASPEGIRGELTPILPIAIRKEGPVPCLGKTVELALAM